MSTTAVQGKGKGLDRDGASSVHHGPGACMGANATTNDNSQPGAQEDSDSSSDEDISGLTASRMENELEGLFRPRGPGGYPAKGVSKPRGSQQGPPPPASNAQPSAQRSNAPQGRPTATPATKQPTAGGGKRRQS